MKGGENIVKAAVDAFSRLDILEPRLRGGTGRYGVRLKKSKVKSEPGAPEGLTKP